MAEPRSTDPLAPPPLDAPPRRGAGTLAAFLAWGPLGSLVGGVAAFALASALGTGEAGAAAALVALALLVGAFPLLGGVAQWRRGRRVGAVVLPAAVWGVFWISIPQTHPHGDARNARVRANTNTVRLGVEVYAQDHDGAFPPGAAWVAMLRTKDYVPGGHLPRSPWAEVPQAQALRPAPPLVAASAIAAGASPTPDRTDLGPGRVPDGATWDQRTYGALIYDVDPKTGIYVVYGVGKGPERRALVVAGATNR